MTAADEPRGIFELFMAGVSVRCLAAYFNLPLLIVEETIRREAP